MINYDKLPDADYRGSIVAYGWEPAEPETFAEALDRKCNDQHIENERLRALENLI